MKISRLLTVLLCLFAVSCGSLYTDSLNPLYNIPLPAFIRVAPPYSAIGVLDTTFGNNGIVVKSGPDFGYASGFNSSIADITIDKQGRILALGGIEYKSGCWYIVIFRFFDNGRLDNGFGTSGGYVIVDDVNDGESNIGSAIKTDSQGRIIVAGFKSVEIEGSPMAIWRFLENGDTDKSFANNGSIVVQGIGSDVSPYFDMCNDITVDDKDRIITTGLTRNIYMGVDMFVHRITSKGTIDIGFGVNGVMILDGIVMGEKYYGNEIGYSVINDSSGNILVTGYGNDSSENYGMFAVRLKDNGVLDQTFNITGSIIISAPLSSPLFGIAFTSDVILNNRGNIIITGRSQNAFGDFDMMLCKYDSQGMQLSTFGNNGIVLSDGAAGIVSSNDYGVSLIQDKQNRFIVLGHSQNSLGDYSMVLWRYDEYGLPDKTFGTDGVVICDSPFTKSAPGGIVMTQDGKIIIGGSYENISGDGEMVIWKYK